MIQSDTSAHLTSGRTNAQVRMAKKHVTTLNGCVFVTDEGVKKAANEMMVSSRLCDLFVTDSREVR